MQSALCRQSYAILAEPMILRISKAALFGLLVAACGDGVLAGGSRAPLDSDGNNDGDGDGDVGGGESTPNPLDAAGSNPNTRLVRLSHAQYANTVRALLAIDETPEAGFAPDALNGFKFDTSNDLRVDPRLGPQYRIAAEELAARVAGDASALARVVPCEPTAAGCAGEFIESFGARAFRRPLAAAESARLLALFELGATLEEEGDAFAAGVALVIEAMLQAPQFLYRAEVSQGQVVDGRAALDDWEVASRLSYLIYDSMPDDELFERARQAELHTPEQVGAEVVRMLNDPRAAAKLQSFHEQAWQVGRYARIAPDREAFPDLPEDLVDRLRASQSRFVESVIEDGGGLRELLTAPYAFVDSELASLYEADVSDDELTRVEFDEGERRGFLMQAGFLASNAYARKTDPIHRGVFILRDVLCRDIPDPPADATQTPLPDTDEPIETTREEISLLTGQRYCPSCHSMINEPGFSFEGFDAVGRTRERENGVDVDTSGSITLDGETVSFSGASELVEALAVSEEAERCYAGRWLEFAYGRELTGRDEALGELLGGTPRGVREMIEALATASEFLSRDVSEDAQ
jgi:Protein of unknown function (DUF1592)/Protein of unknown function (DUF1588)/Protein of unknown function (DUF1595)/Protein of unknown function (DUF1587)/Protein of unknown function (DUF1585)